VRIAHYYHAKRGKKSKKHILSRTDAYHGSTYLTGSITGRPADRSPYLHYLEDWIHHVSSPNYYRAHEVLPGGIGKGMSEQQFCDYLIDELEAKIMEVGPDNIACFFAEPVMGAGGVIVPPKGYHKRSLDICHKHDILYISDEVVTAFGRLGHFFASEAVFGIVPDMIVTAKGLTSGYQPLGACIFSDRIYEAMSTADPDGWFTNGYTYSGHPVACAAALANIAIMEREDLTGHVQKMGPYLEQQLNTLLELPIVGNVRGHKFMMCVENVMDKDTREHFPDEVNIGKRISDHCERLGLIVRPLGALNVISPPLTLNKEEVDELVSLLRQGIEATLADLRTEGHYKD
jgi:adenosylmethionine-8-amino-7-oxononanoate aminotransferase